MPRLPRPTRRTKTPFRYGGLITSVLLAVGVGWLAHYGLAREWLVGLVVLLIIAVESLPYRTNLKTDWLMAMPLILGGASVAVIIALSPRALTQIVVVAVYAAWRGWRAAKPERTQSFSELLVMLALVYEAIFLAAAVWRTPAWICLVLLYAASYILVYQGLHIRGERLARVLAATWALIVVQVSWVFLNWLVTYVLVGNYFIIPQAALILTGLAYCFGGIYLSQRQQALTRMRLAEYLLIALLLVIIVASSTPWRGTL
ncbi:hypothetical protein HJC99_04605 [Candidatus Saccharibacteria bacterium]|nr:hypothetical protein [Candidatus Saccharibacteria bacterium]